jgi:hypothetical protein
LEEFRIERTTVGRPAASRVTVAVIMRCPLALLSATSEQANKGDDKRHHEYLPHACFLTAMHITNRAMRKDGAEATIG